MMTDAREGIVSERIPLGHGLSLAIGTEAEDGGDYPTGRLQKGMLLLDGGESLADEGLGFGVPVLKQGMRTIFAGRRDVTCRRAGSQWEVRATYRMDLVERLVKEDGGRADAEALAPGDRIVGSRALYAVKDSLAAMHRRVPPLRTPLAAVSAAARRALRLKTTYVPTSSCGAIAVTHVVQPESKCEGADRGAGHGAETCIAVTVDPSGLTAPSVSEVVVMNELGARQFDRYEDTGGAVLLGADIGSWDAVDAVRASFVSSDRAVAFSLAQVPGARLYRGRELVGARLAWAGFGYTLARTGEPFRYDLTIARRVKNASEIATSA